jgi:hypothetical protein
MNEKTFAEATVGVKPPVGFILDASVLDGIEEQEIVREEIKQNHIEYELPDGLHKLDLFEECRILNLLDDFDAVYDFTMRSLEGKSVIIRYKHGDGRKTVLCSFQVTDKFQNLRAIAAIDENPCLVNWLVDYIKALLTKKFPVLTSEALPAQAPEKKGSRKNRRLRTPKPRA